MKKIIVFIFICIFSVIFAFSGYKIFSILKDNKQADNAYTDIAENAIIEKMQEDSESSDEALVNKEEFTLFDIDFEKLKKQNKDTIGWIYLPDSPINYPVLQTDNNETYLERMFNGNYNRAGSIFADYRNDFITAARNFIIYGHNMKNGTMFAGLKKYKSQSYYEANPVIYYLTPENKYKINLIAGFTTKYNSEIFDFGNSQEEFDTFVNNSINSSTFKSEKSYKSGDTIVTLSTCIGSDKSDRFIILGILEEY